MSHRNTRGRDTPHRLHHHPTGQPLPRQRRPDPLAAATGDDMLAVAWKQNGALHLALARGANALQVRRLDKGETMSLAFSPVNRLHVAYEKNNEIYYRYADQGAHPADQANEPVTSGRNPVIVLDRRNYAHIVYEQDGQLYHAAQVQTGIWHINPVTPGTAFTATPIRGRDFGYLVAYQTSGQMTLARWLVDEATGFLTPTWDYLTTIPLSLSHPYRPGPPRLPGTRGHRLGVCRLGGPSTRRSAHDAPLQPTRLRGRESPLSQRHR
ncbi:MAG: hypothetical protein IPL78_18730 [Chloroflexi bacterium]|nr:hypothetical protein [Chloroflexota bacterium]